MAASLLPSSSHRRTLCVVVLLATHLLATVAAASDSVVFMRTTDTVDTLCVGSRPPESGVAAVAAFADSLADRTDMSAVFESQDDLPSYFYVGNSQKLKLLHRCVDSLVFYSYTPPAAASAASDGARGSFARIAALPPVVAQSAFIMSLPSAAQDNADVDVTVVNDSPRPLTVSGPFVGDVAATDATVSATETLSLNSELPPVVSDYLVTVALSQSQKLRGAILVTSSPSTSPPGTLHSVTYVIYMPFPNSDSGICTTDADIPCFTLSYQTVTFFDAAAADAAAVADPASASAGADGSAGQGQDQQQQAPPRVMLEGADAGGERQSAAAAVAAVSRAVLGAGHRKFGRILVADIAFAMTADRVTSAAAAVTRCYYVGNKLVCTTS